MKNKIVNIVIIIILLLVSNFSIVTNAFIPPENNNSTSYIEGWPQTYDFNTIGNSITCDNEGNIFVCGNKNINNENYDIFIIKYNSNGEVLEEYSLETNKCEDVTDISLDSYGNMIIFAAQGENLNDIENCNSNMYIAKYNSNGIELWNYSYKPSSQFRMGRGCIDSNDNIIVVGTTGNVLESSSIILIKLDQHGNKIWNITYSYYLTNYACDVMVDSQDNIIIGSTGFSYEFYGYNIIKYDPDGFILWESRIESRDAKAITIDKEDNIIITGSYFLRFNSIPKIVIYTVKFDPSGNLLWDSTYNSCLHDLPFDIKSDSYGNIITLGISANDELTEFENVIVIYDTDGKEISLRKFDINGWLNSLTIDNSNHIYVTGFNEMRCYTNAFYEIEPPQIELLRPEKGNFYILNKKLFSLPESMSMWSICVGPIDIELEPENSDDFEKVEFYINEELKCIAESCPFEWTWISFGAHVLSIKAYSKTGPIKHYQIYLIKLF